MPIFIAALLGGLVSAAGSIVGRVLIALGIGYVTYTGVNAGLGGIWSFVQTSFGSAPATVMGVLTLLKVDVDISILSSAIAAKLVLGGLSSGGAITKMVIK
jgi:hypothetical protein